MSATNVTYMIEPEFKDRIDKCLAENLRGAQSILIFETERVEREDYWERIYMVAWKRDFSMFGVLRNCGTHRVCINSKGEAMAVWGHYDLTYDEAFQDANTRVK